MSDVFDSVEVRPSDEEFTHWSPSEKILKILRSTFPGENGKAEVPSAAMRIAQDNVTKVETQLRKNANYLGYGVKIAKAKNSDGTVTVKFAAKKKTERKPDSKKPGRKPGQKNAPKPAVSAQQGTQHK